MNQKQRVYRDGIKKKGYKIGTLHSSDACTLPPYTAQMDAHYQWGVVLKVIAQALYYHRGSLSDENDNIHSDNSDRSKT